MQVSRQRQFQNETNMWRRLLGFMMAENVHLKNQLSEVLNDRFNESMLNKIEMFHNQFINQDELIGILRNDIAELDELLAVNIQGVEDFQLIELKLAKLRSTIKSVEKQFSLMKFDFNNYLTTHFQI